MARINNDNQENINKIKNKLEAYRNNYASPYFVLNFDDIDCERYEIEEIYNNPQDYTDYQNIWVEYVYNDGTSLIGYIKGGEE